MVELLRYLLALTVASLVGNLAIELARPEHPWLARLGLVPFAAMAAWGTVRTRQRQRWER
jgi:hypothetical protein